MGSRWEEPALPPYDAARQRRLAQQERATECGRTWLPTSEKTSKMASTHFPPKWSSPIVLVAIGVVVLAVLNVPAVRRAADSPALCGSCHVMAPQADSHLRSSHGGIPCGHCHLPRGILRYPAAKAYAGTKDVLTFLAGAVPETIRLTPGGKRVVQENCLHCHGQMVPNTAAGGGHWCFDCHRRVAHGP